MKPYVVGITGNYGSGKDTFADVLVATLEEHFPGNRRAVRRMNFADSVKAYAKTYFGWDGTKGHASVLVDGNKYTGGRQVLQGVGQMMRECVSKDYWLRRVRESIKGSGNNLEIVVIPDVRYLNELRWVSENGAIARIIRPGFDGDNSPSETEQNSAAARTFVRWEIRNDATLDQLAHNAKRVAETILNEIQ